jgi:prepilin-type N-terminal cleavage/methylation domain-containing protein
MQPRSSNQTNRALTLVEVLVVIAVLAVLVVVLLPTGPHVGRKAMRINCVNNLKEIGVAYRDWDSDYGEKYPMSISVTNGGAMELALTGNACTIFRVMSNDLQTPKILVCPADASRVPATNFTSDLNGKISYFINVDAMEAYPQMILSGDDNFEISGVPIKSGLLELSNGTPIFWTAARHNIAGNISLADGSVQTTTSSYLRQLVQQTGVATNRLAIP